MPSSIHQAVLVEETMLVLNVRPGGWYVDGTLGGATHTQELLRRSAPTGRVLSLDVDPKALERAQDHLTSESERWSGVEGNFRQMAELAHARKFFPVDGVLLDLGFSSDELADRQKGLSFLENGSLDMRFGPKANEDGLTAADIVNSWPHNDLEKMLRNFGEERYAGRIASAIIEARQVSRIVGTLDLTAVVKKAVPASYEHGRIHPATRTFQALRIAVNDELEALKQAIDGAREILKPGGRIAIISFHSLEDRIVKHAFRSAEDLEIITKKPMTPSLQELIHNPRARSAKLRAATKK
ncbi:16S rRNA (cytosine(1402)-N(4))-methyltransferase RsmH [Candidatus Uhrbacteria bacterium]|nr:16S rRNA (cytosine(1402)-N(4))-methyltransferase RsmH [Candidatus Uhrbacteria bacterium]